MSLIRETTPAQIAGRDEVESRPIYRSDAELRMRVWIERWGRKKWPDARVVHELVMNRGTVRADLAFIGRAHIAVVEIKSEADTTSRLMNQVATFRLAVPELWLAIADRHTRDADLVRHLLPSIGTLVRRSIEMEFEEAAPSVLFDPHPRALLALLWRDELDAEARRARLATPGNRLSHGKLVDRLLVLSPEEKIRAVCRQMRGRQAFWRSDPPVLDQEGEKQ